MKSRDGLQADKASDHVGVTPGILSVLAQKPEPISKLDQVFGTRIGEREPSAGPQHPRHFGEVLGREDADDEINSFIPHRPFGPQIGDCECNTRPTPRSLPRRSLRDVEAQANNGARQPPSYPVKAMARTGTGSVTASRCLAPRNRVRCLSCGALSPPAAGWRLRPDRRLT